MASGVSTTMATISYIFAIYFTGVLAIDQTYCSTLNTGTGDGTYAQYQSTGLCFNQCRDSGNYAFAIVQGQKCWCSSYIPSQQQAVGDCNQGCPGTNLESCGGTNLFGYISVSGRSAAGTAGAGGVQTSTTQAFTRPSRSFAQSPSPSPPSSSSTTPSPYPTTSPTQSPLPTTSSSSVRTTTPATTPGTTTDVPTQTTRIITVSGAIVTETVTSITRPESTLSATTETTQPQKSNTGVIVGAVIGGVAGLILLALLAFFLLRRRNQSTGKRSLVPAALKRDASVLSRSGLMATAPVGEKDRSIEENRFGSQRHSQLYNDPEDGRGSAAGGSQDGQGGTLARRNSRPLVYDQRLNPAALMENWQHNGSRTSIGTLQDQRDYSRPLGVTNPDP